MDLDTTVVHRAFCASDQLRRHLGPAFQAKHLFNLDPVHGHGLDRQAKGFASGRQIIMTAFSKAAPRPIPADPKDWSTKIVAVTTQGKDIVCVASVSTRPDPRNPGQTYTTTHFDMWRFVDGKADEHWDEGAINAGGGGAGKAKQ